MRAIITDDVEEIEFPNDDCWNLDHILAPIILAGLKKFRKLGVLSYPSKIDEAPIEIEDGLSRWYWAIDEMIWAFEYFIKDDVVDMIDNKKNYDRMVEGMILFGKYYGSLWN